MAIYNNDYKKQEDYVLWELHEIRNQISERKETPEQINSIGKSIIKKYNLKNLKLVTSRA